MQARRLGTKFCPCWSCTGVSANALQVAKSTSSCSATSGPRRSSTRSQTIFGAGRGRGAAAGGGGAAAGGGGGGGAAATDDGDGSMAHPACTRQIAAISLPQGQRLSLIKELPGRLPWQMGSYLLVRDRAH